MVADKSGSLVGMKRHDYLPFGEEVAAGVGGRTTQQGYVGNADGNRKRWAELERDDETGLDYAQARYYSSTQGRFTSVDPGNFQAMRDLHDPQSWNAYAYVNNNPLSRNDPDGRGWREKLGNFLNGWGWRSNEEVQQLEDKWRNWLRDREKEAGGTLVNCPGGCASGAEAQKVNIDSLSRNQVFSYAASLKEAIQSGNLEYYSRDQIDQMAGMASAVESVARKVIGKMSDLNRLGELKPGESTLNLPDKGSPRANWQQNASRLREAMREGQLIRDASVDPATGALRNNAGFLRAERNLLRSQGWQYNPATRMWHPPGQ
jgi:RHS repeat-associated protein